MMNWLLRRPGPSGFSYKSTAEDVTNGIDASGSIAIVTGATSGIGAETARVLSLRGAHVIMGVRNLSAGNAVKEKLTKEIDNAKVDVLELDLSSLASVQNFASNFKSLNLPLNILINNAGVMMCPYELSKDGIELQFATNHLGHFFLTNLLLETMKKTALETGIEGRIVNVSSEAHRFCYSGGIRFDKINDQSGYSATMAYGQSKLANILHANELTKRLKEEGSNVTANSLHPGTIATNLFRHSKLAEVFSQVFKFALKNIPQGAATQCFVALNPKVRGVSGKYFLDSNEHSPSSLGTDAELARKLWEFSQGLISLHVKEHAPN